MTLLTPAQRSAAIQEALAKLPVFRNFVTKNYDTHLFGVTFEAAADLKTASFSVDQLVLLERFKKR